jgi:branched-chain amino acid transport system permease protein
MGIPSNRIFSIVMGLSAGIAALAGVLVAPFQTVIPGMGLLPLVKAFAIVIVGGLGSIPGSILGALLLGYSETIIAFNVSFEWAQIVSVAAVLVTLILRPAGFLGKRAAF